MTPAQQQYVQRLSAIEAARVRADLIKRQEFDRANRFWAAWEELHPTKPAQDTVQIAQAAWSSQGFAQQQEMVNVVDWAVSTGRSTRERPVASDDVQRSLCSQLSGSTQKLCQILSDGQPHSREELLNNSQAGDVEFRKHISDIRKFIDDNDLPYYIPKNKSFSKGVYQLKYTTI